MSEAGQREPSGRCALCGQAAQTRCVSCRLAFYCGREHQRADWPRHKSACRAYEMREAPELGRHLVATRDLAADEPVFTEAPQLWGPSAHVDSRVCVGCGIRDALWRCPGCYWPACKIACSGLLDEDRHGYECKILAKAKLLPRCENLLILRALLLRHRDPKRWRAFSRLESHEPERGPGSDAYEEMRAVAEYFGPLLALDQAASEVLPLVCGILDVNSLETNPPEGSAGIYETACRLEHRCIANTRHTFAVDERGRPRITVIAVKPIKKGDHLSTTYTHVLWCTRQRREHLLATKYFVCRCERCADRSELGSHLGSLKCPCKQGWMTPEAPLEPNSDWTCDACPGALSSVEAGQLVDRLAEEVEAAMNAADKDILSDLLFRLGVLLHPCHQHCLTVSHTLLQLLEPGEPLKAELCRRMLEVFAIVDPHGARLPVYQVIALRELAACPGEDRKALLAKAIHVLRYEPALSAGGLIAKLIQAEL